LKSRAGIFLSEAWQQGGHRRKGVGISCQPLLAMVHGFYFVNIDGLFAFYHEGSAYFQW